MTEAIIFTSVPRVTPVVNTVEDIINRLKTGFGVPMGNWNSKTISIATGKSRSTTTQGGADSRQWAQSVTKAVY
jgi:hypothetical protein